MINTSDEGIYYVPRSYTAETEIYWEVNFSRRGLMKKILCWFNQRREPQKEFFVWATAHRCGGVLLRRLVKNKRIFYGQADRKRTVSFLWIIFGVFFILDYDCMCSEMDFTPEKAFSSNYKISQLLLREGLK